jgi:ZIP family zinc transporter
MTAHNLPEGFAVAFSSFTPLGPTMVLAIAAHNIPEGVVVAAPVFAATGSRLAALGLAAASGMSEPVGAAAALLLARPWLPGAAAAAGGGGAAAAALTESRLALVLAASGGVMAAVCAVDLYPQGKKCAAPSRLAAGSALGALAMAATLALGV